MLRWDSFQGNATSVIKANEAKDSSEERVKRVQVSDTVAECESGGDKAPKAKRIEKFDMDALKAFTDSLPPATESAVDLIRRMRDESY